MVDGAVADSARQEKEARYPELVGSSRCEVVVVALETGGRWSAEAVEFVEDLASVKVRDLPVLQRGAARLAWIRRWSRLMSTSCAVSFAQSLVSPSRFAEVVDGYTPSLADLFECYA